MSGSSYLAMILALVLASVLTSAPGAENVPQITVIGDKSAGPADGPSSDAMQDLLNWGIQHSDPERIKELMQMYKDKNLTIKDVYGQDVIDALFVNEGSVMRDMVTQISDFANSSVTDEDLESALERLQELVEQVDNAGNLHAMGGLRPLLELAVSADRGESLRTLALWTLGVAVQNNPPVQDDLHRLGGVRSLLGRLSVCGSSSVDSAGIDYCGKLLFAISGLVKNNATIQSDADSQGLFDWLSDVGIQHSSPAVTKKSLGLLDIALSQHPDLSFLERLSTRQGAVADSLLLSVRAGLASSDTDSTEKALRLINRLVSLRPMLFRPSFRSELSEAVALARKGCESVHGADDEFCEGLAGLAKHADLALAARELSDDDL
jgi:hypothetical protein